MRLKKPNKVKDVKRLSRETKVAGRAGPHKNKSEKRQHKKRTNEYLAEYEDEIENEETTD